MKVIEANARGTPERQPFEAVYEEYYLQILRYTQRKVGNRQDAEDLTGDALFYCYQNYESYDPAKSTVKTWLYLVVNSRIKNYYRDKKSTAEYSELNEWLFRDEPDMERAVYLEQLQIWMARAIRQLPERQQKVLGMRYFQNREYEEIERELGLSYSNVRVILSRTLDKLKLELQNSRSEWEIP